MDRIHGGDLVQRAAGEAAFEHGIDQRNAKRLCARLRKTGGPFQGSDFFTQLC